MFCAASSPGPPLLETRIIWLLRYEISLPSPKDVDFGARGLSNADNAPVSATVSGLGGGGSPFGGVRDAQRSSRDQSGLPVPILSPLSANSDGRILLPYPGLFEFILSSPLLEDLGPVGYGDSQSSGDSPYGSQAVFPSTSPSLTGTLGFYPLREVGDVA